MQVTLIDFTLSRLCTADGAGAYCDLEADPELFQGPKGDCQVRMQLHRAGLRSAQRPSTAPNTVLSIITMLWLRSRSSKWL